MMSEVDFCSFFNRRYVYFSNVPLFELNGCRRLTGAIIEHAVHMLDLIDDAAGDSAQNIPRHIIALCSHEVGGGHSTQGHSVIIGALVAHDAHTVHVGQGCIVLADLLIEARLGDLLTPDRVGILHDCHLLRGHFADDADAQTRAGERLTADQILGQTQLTASLTHFVLKQVAQRLHQLLEVHGVGQTADVVVALDNSGLTAQTALNNIRVNGTLCQKIHLADLLCLLFKYADELFTNDLTLAFRLSDASQLCKVAVAGIHTDKVDIKAIGIARTKDCTDLFLLVLTQQDALRHNFRAVKVRAGDLPLCAVVKADSYGHGAVQCARVFAQEGAAWLAVSCLTEAVQLRQDGQTLPILILGHVQPEYAQTLIHEDITVACYSTEQAQNLSAAAVKAGGRVKIHLKADTGMGRIGFALRTDFDAAIREMLAVCELPGLEMTGLFQHFSVADDTAEENVAYTAEQHALFVRAFHALKAAGREPQTVHCDNSAGVMLHPDWPEGLPRERCMARPGIILYGYDPSDEVRFGQFRPVMTLKTVVSMVKEMQPGQSASYGRRFTADKPTLVATLCTGYADGYPRQLSCGKGIVEIHGKACPVLGRVCMDQMMVDVTGIPDIHEGDEAILWGGSVSDTAETIARKTDTISYEVLCGVSRRVPRVYLEHGKIVDVEDWILEA